MIKIVDTEVEAEGEKAERVISRSYRQSGDSYRKTEGCQMLPQGYLILATALAVVPTVVWVENEEGWRSRR